MPTATSAAAHWAGLEKGPAALRGAGLIDQLRAAGFTDVRTTALYDYWWAPAQLFVAT